MHLLTVQYGRKQRIGDESGDVEDVAVPAGKAIKASSDNI